MATKQNRKDKIDIKKDIGGSNLKLYIIRHGQTKWNVERRLQGWNNSDLTQQGIENAKKLAHRLKDIDFDYIYSSTQQRAFHTAEIIRGNRNMEIIQLEGLREMGFGSWEGMKIDDINLKYNNEYDIYLNTPHLYEPINGESFKELFTRAENSLKYILSKKADNILIVSHGVTIKALIAIIKGIPLEELYKLPVHPGTALNICEVEGQDIRFILEGDTSHME